MRVPLCLRMGCLGSWLSDEDFGGTSQTLCPLSPALQRWKCRAPQVLSFLRQSIPSCFNQHLQTSVVSHVCIFGAEHTLRMC